MAETLYKQYLDTLAETMEANLPEGLTPEQREDFLSQLTDEQFKAADEACAWMGDIRYQHAAQVAAEQENVPGETLGSGPAGRQPTPKWEDLTPEQRREAALEGVDMPEG